MFVCTCVLMCVIVTGVDSQYTVTIERSPLGTPVGGVNNIVDYPILSNVSLTCMVDPSPPDGTTYEWNTGGCYASNNGNQNCFPASQSAQKSISGTNLLAKDAGLIICTAVIGAQRINSESLTLRISGKCIGVSYSFMKLL